MEGKELYGNEDEDLNPKSKKEEEDAEDFGLPEMEDSDDKTDELEEPFSESWEENKEEEESIAYPEATDEFSEEDEDTTEQEAEFEEEVDQTHSVDDEDEYRSSYYEEDYNKKKSPVGWIIFAILVIIAIIIGAFWWMNRDVTPEPTISETPGPVFEQPVQETEPEVVEAEPEPFVDEQPINTGAGVFEINEPTGRYQVIVASAIDVDLLTDYAKKLAAQGMTCNIIAPSGKKLFYRLSIADFVLLDDATIKSEELKSTFGEDVWVIRY